MDTAYPPPKIKIRAFGNDLSLKVYIINWSQWSSICFKKFS